RREGKIGFTLESLAPRPLEVHAWCRVLLGEGRDVVETWEARIGPGERRPVEMSLGPALSDLHEVQGKTVTIGAEVRGRGEGVGGRYRLDAAEGRLVLLGD